MSALRALARDGWVIGIACAAALAYSTVNVLDQILTLVFSIVDGVPAAAYEGEDPGLGGFSPRDFFSYDVVVNGHIILLEPLFRALALLGVVVVASAFALHATRSPGDENA